jgi:hypothetical protein
MSFLSRFRSKIGKKGDALRVEPAVDTETPVADPTGPAPGTGPVTGVETAESRVEPVAPQDVTLQPSVELPIKLRSRKKIKTDTERSIIIGLQVAGSASWFRLNADGRAEEITELSEHHEEATFGKARVFRGMDYDRGLRAPTKLRGKALRNNLMRNLGDMPIWFNKEGISWFTRRGSQTMSGYPVRPLAAALWQFAKGQGSTPSTGVLLRIRFPMGTTVLWAFLAIGANGAGTFQSMRTSNEAFRPTFNQQMANGVLEKEFQTLDVDSANLWSFLSASPTKKVPTYPQRGEWLGKPKTLIGKVIAASGLVVLVTGAGFWLWSEATLHHALAQAHSESVRMAQFKMSQQDFFSAHIKGISLVQEIPLKHLLNDAESLWKPGTTVTMEDHMSASMETGAAPISVLARPGSGAAGAGNPSGALFQVTIPVTKNLGPGQAYWVSQNLLRAVISQTPPQGIVLQSVISEMGGNGYVALFGGH